MVNQFVQAHGKITRAEAAELCHLSESQAFRLLKGISERGLLKWVGGGRGTYYQRVEKTRGHSRCLIVIYPKNSLLSCSDS